MTMTMLTIRWGVGFVGFVALWLTIMTTMSSVVVFGSLTPPPSLSGVYTSKIYINDTVKQEDITLDATEIAYYSSEYQSCLQKFTGKLIQGNYLYLFEKNLAFEFDSSSCQGYPCPSSLDDVNLPPFHYASMMSFVRNETDGEGHDTCSLFSYQGTAPKQTYYLCVDMKSETPIWAKIEKTEDNVITYIIESWDTTDIPSSQFDIPPQCKQ